MDYLAGKLTNRLNEMENYWKLMQSLEVTVQYFALFTKQDPDVMPPIFKSFYFSALFVVYVYTGTVQLYVE